MPITLDLNDLIDYTDWERQKWHGWMRQHGEHVLKTSAGPHGDGRFNTVGDVVKHIFSAEKRYVDRLSGRPLTDTTPLPADSLEPLFQFGEQSRRELRQFVETLPPQQWDAPQDFKIVNSVLRATPRKIITHVVLHETRHWAQIATMLRMSGVKKYEFHDFLFSPVLSGEPKGEPKTA